MRGVVVVLAVASGTACRSSKDDSPATVEPRPATAAMVRAADEASARRDAQRAECKQRITIYDGSIAVDARDYVHPVAHGDAWTEDAISDAELDRVVATAPRIDFTLDYPFDTSFTSSITGELTLRRTIDAVRRAFRHMYEGTTERDIPNLYNKDVTGPYGRAFHAIGDLVIERIDLCDGRRLDVSIGS